MNFKSFALRGVAIVGLAATTLPAMARTHHPSTPAEQKQTDDLNAQALTKAQGQQQTASNDQGQSSIQAQPDTTATDQATQSQSGQPINSSITGTQTATPNNQSAQADTGASSNEQTAMNTTEGSQSEATEGQSQTVAPSSAASGGTSTVSLAQIANPPQTLMNASVETVNGQAVGAVQKVVTDGSGKAQAVTVALLGAQSKIVSLEANQVKYDQSRNVVVAQLSADQIQALPATPQG